jgi:hypothetical protein
MDQTRQGQRGKLEARDEPGGQHSFHCDATAELGEQIAAGQSRLQAEQGKEEKRLAKVRTLSRNLKMTLSPTAARRPETVPALERLNELLNEEEPV